MKVITFLKLLGILLIVAWFYNRCALVKTYPQAVERSSKNYGKQVEQICKELDLEPSYFKALIILECAGKKPAKSRFEKHVFEKLKAVRAGKQESYSKLDYKKLKGRSDSELKMLATSWGPLQIMGYHCFNLGIGIDDLKGANSLENGIIWAKKNYGQYLKRRDYQNAFHFHNTGKKHPVWFAKTHDPDYVRKGMSYMLKFRQ